MERYPMTPAFAVRITGSSLKWLPLTIAFLIAAFPLLEPIVKPDTFGSRANTLAIELEFVSIGDPDNAGVGKMKL